MVCLMVTRILLCSDGSDASVAAIEAGSSLFSDSATFEIVMVVDGPDDADMVGASGHAGPAMSPEEFELAERAAVAETERALEGKAARLGLVDAARIMLRGDPGQAICKYAEEVSAAAIVVGSRGRSGLKRAVLGSVSDYVTRNAPCSVVVTPPTGIS